MKALEHFQEQYSTKPTISQQAVFKIDPEFQNKIPPIGDNEFKQLRENIIESGEVYEPLVVWNGILVDGHNRWKVIQENPNVKYKVRTMEFADKWAAFEWMYKNQLGRRNLTDEQRTYMIGKMYEARKKSIVRNDKGQFSPCTQNGNTAQAPTRVSNQIAGELGIGKGTVLRANQFMKGVDAIREVSPEAADKVLSGKANVTKADVQGIIKMSPNDVQQAVDTILNPPAKVNALKGRTAPRTNNGRDNETRKMYEAISKAVASQTDDSVSPAYDLHDLIEEIEVNGDNYINALKSTMGIRAGLISSKDAKERVFKAIANVIQGITKVRGEYCK